MSGRVLGLEALVFGSRVLLGVAQGDRHVLRIQLLALEQLMQSRVVCGRLALERVDRLPCIAEIRHQLLSRLQAALELAVLQEGWAAAEEDEQGQLLHNLGAPLAQQTNATTGR